MLNSIAEFFKEIFKNDKGVYNEEARKVTVKSVIYWVIGLILSLVIPACLVYLEVWQFDWNVFKFIWGEPAQDLLGKGLYRALYFIMSFVAILSFLLAGFLSAYRINGKQELLEDKKILRFIFVLGLTIAVYCFVAANIIY